MPLLWGGSGKEKRDVVSVCRVQVVGACGLYEWHVLGRFPVRFVPLICLKGIMIPYDDGTASYCVDSNHLRLRTSD